MFDQWVESRERRARLMGEMMHRFGALQHHTPTIGEAMAFERAVRVCMACGAVRECESWMAETEGTAGAERFCPNARLFASLQDSPLGDAPVPARRASPEGPRPPAA